MARPKKTDETLLVSVLEKYYAEEACGNAGAIRFTDLEKYAALQGIQAKEYEFRRNSAVRKRLDELRKIAEKQEPRAEMLVYKGLDVEGLLRTSRDLSELKKKLEDIDSYWKSVYDSCSELMEDNRMLIAKKADIEKQMALHRREAMHTEALYKASEKENRNLRRENAYLRQMMEKYLYPDLARQLMSEAHLPVDRPRNATKKALDEMIEGKQPLPFDGIQKEKMQPQSRAEQLLDEMRRQAGE
ncbi:MAG: hypothetical protein IJ088_01170 [Clostridia bacterium]|nr:hypothetical protein [Clostridia bacterium]